MCKDAFEGERMILDIHDLQRSLSMDFRINTVLEATMGQECSQNTEPEILSGLFFYRTFEKSHLDDSGNRRDDNMKMNFNGRKLLGYKINGSGPGLRPMREACCQQSSDFWVCTVADLSCYLYNGLDILQTQGTVKCRTAESWNRSSKASKFQPDQLPLS